MIILLEDREELFREFLRKEHWSVHDPGVLAADLYAGEQPLFACLKTPLGSLALHIYRRVPCAALVGVVHIVAHPVVGREKISVPSDKTLPGTVERCQRILIVIFRVVEKLHAELVDQILELLLQISHNDGDIRDARFMQLLDLPLDHTLAVDLKKSLRRLEGQRYKSGPKSRREDHGAVHPVIS